MQRGNEMPGNKLTALKMMLLAAASAQKLPAQAVQTRPPIAEYARPLEYPHADEAAVAQHFDKAKRIAGDDLYTFFNSLCIQDQLYKLRTTGAQYNGIIPPQMVFDDLYYVGQMAVSAWVLNTSDGLILFDGLDNAGEAAGIVEAGMVKLGLDPRRVKYVVITHAHADHYGGAQYFKDRYGSVLVASSEDWAEMAKPSVMDRNPLFDHAPSRGGKDIAVDDGSSLRLGNRTVHFALTPGHTPGTLSIWFEVRDKGAAHRVGLYGGIGMPRNVAAQRQQIGSLTHWLEVTQAAGVDAQIGNHPLHFDGPARLELLKYRTRGEPNPFVMGADGYQRYIQLQRECVKLQLAREGEVAN